MKHSQQFNNHYSVMLEKSIELLNIVHDRSSGIFADGTFGRGGHSKIILNHLGSEGRLFAFDKDLVAINFAAEAINDKRFTILHDSFANLDCYNKTFDGILLDLGVSSPQLDDATRGFSFMKSGDLDMRMDTTRGENCARWLAQATEQEIADVLWNYGEERLSRKIAQNIVAYRTHTPIKNTLQLAKIIEQSFPFHSKDKHPATRSFQALRIKINNELQDLEIFLDKIPKLLNIGGRVVIISFHSLEDRLVKNRFNQLTTAKKLPRWVMARDEEPKFRLIAKKVKAEIDELNQNVRSRSAILRCVEKFA